MTKRNVAVLIDIENVNEHASIETALDESGRFGNVVIKRAIGNWSAMPEKMQNHLTHLGVALIHQVSAGKGSNSSDMRLTIEAMDLLHGHPDQIDVFVFATSDADFVPLATRLRSTGKYVVGCGYASSTDMWKTSVDKFITLGSADSQNAEPRSTISKVSAVNPLPKKTVKLIRKVLAELSKEHPKGVLGAVLKNRILELDPEFDNKKLGHRSFKKLMLTLDFALVPDPPKTGDFRVSLCKGM